MHFNRIGCRLHNIRPYFTCAQPPIRPYSPRLLSRFSPSSSSGAPPIPPPMKTGFRGSTRNVYEQMHSLIYSRLIPTTCLVVARSFPCRSVRALSAVICADNYGTGGVVFHPESFFCVLCIGFLSARRWKRLIWEKFMNCVLVSFEIIVNVNRILIFWNLHSFWEWWKPRDFWN